MILDGLTLLITGGTGSLGNSIIHKVMTGTLGYPKRIIVFSRDEFKQHHMRVYWDKAKQPIDDLRDFSAKDTLEFRLGDVRNYDSVLGVLRKADIVINTAALKQVPHCECHPFEAVWTNIIGINNIVRGISEHRLPIQKVVTISTDKACKPVNVMGMTKAIQERIVTAASLDCPNTTLLAVRYGNVIASRGSVVPHFREQIANGGPLTITALEMTRFLLTLDQAVETVFEALRSGCPGETLIPKAASARVCDVARAMIGSRKIETKVIGIRPGEKLHEILISEEECKRTSERNGYYVIQNIIPNASDTESQFPGPIRQTEYSSNDKPLPYEQVRELLSTAGYLT